MKYTLKNGHVVSFPDKDIERLQRSLKISKDEAILTWLADEDYITDSTVEELSAKAKKNRITATVHQAKAENSEKKARKPREKKENPLKKQIITGIHDFFLDEIGHSLPKNAEISIRNEEKYIDLVIEGRNFTINLVEHRPKKDA